MSTSEWLGKVMLIEQAVAQCKVEITETKSTTYGGTQDEQLRATITTLCHDIIAIIGRPQVERSLRAWSEVYPQQQGSSLIKETSIYRQLGKRRQRSWDPLERFQHCKADGLGSPRATLKSASLPSPTPKMVSPRTADGHQTPFCSPPITRSAIESDNGLLECAPSSPSYSDYRSHVLPPASLPPPGRYFPSPETRYPEIGGIHCDSARVLPPIYTSPKHITELPAIYSLDSLQRHDASTHRPEPGALDGTPTAHYCHDPQEPLKFGPTLSGSGTSPPRPTCVDRGGCGIQATSGFWRISSERDLSHPIYELPDALAKHLEEYLAERGSSLHLAAFRDWEGFYNCPFCSQKARRNYDRPGPFVDHLIRHWDSFQIVPRAVSSKQ